MFAFKGQRNQHVRKIHEKRRDFPCPRCESDFTAANSLKMHIRCVLEKRRDIPCGYCEYVAGTTCHLEENIDCIHLKRRDHACCYCNALELDVAFGRKSSLAEHVHEKMPRPKRRKSNNRGRLLVVLVFICDESSL